MVYILYYINGSIFYLTFIPWNNKASEKGKCRVFNDPIPVKMVLRGQARGPVPAALFHVFVVSNRS